MRSLVTLVITAAMCFAAGFGAVRWGQRGRLITTAPIPSSNADGKMSAERELPAIGGESRMDAFLALAKKRSDPDRDRTNRFIRAQLKDDLPTEMVPRQDLLISTNLSADHATYAALLKVEPKEFADREYEFKSRLKEIASWYDGASIGEAWMDRWLEIDRVAALQFINRSNIFAEFGSEKRLHLWKVQEQSALGLMFRALATREMDWTGTYLTYLSSLAATSKRDLAVYQFMKAAAEQNPANARTFVEQFSAGANRKAALAGFALGLAKSDARQALELRLRDSVPHSHDDASLADIIRFAEIGNVRELLSLIREPQFRNELATKALESMWARSRPDLLAWIKEETVNAKWDSFAGFYEWALMIARCVEPAQIQDTMNWGAAGAGPHTLVMFALAERWADQDPGAARDWLEANQPPSREDFGFRLAAIFEVLCDADFAGTREWAKSLPAGAFGDEARTCVAAHRWAGPEATDVQAAYVPYLESDGDGRRAEDVAELLARRDPAAAGEWAMRLPAGTRQGRAIPKVAALWSHTDAGGARAWIDTLPAGVQRERAIKEHATKVAYSDPRSAVALVEQITDAVVRADATAEVYATWREEDPEGSRAWVRNLAKVNEAWRASLLNDPQ